MEKKLSDLDLHNLIELRDDKVNYERNLLVIAKEKVNLEFQEESLKAFYRQILAKEAKLEEKIGDKYGLGAIDLEKGTITVESQDEDVKPQSKKETTKTTDSK